MRLNTPGVPIDCRAPCGPFEDAVLSAESARDASFLSQTSSGPACRVVELWHPGNLAWAQARSPPDAFACLLRGTEAAVVAATSGADSGRRSLVLVQPLRATPAAVLSRRAGAAGAAARERVPCAAPPALKSSSGGSSAPPLLQLNSPQLPDPAADFAPAKSSAAAGEGAGAEEEEAALVEYTQRVAVLVEDCAAALGLRLLPPVRHHALLKLIAAACGPSDDRRAPADADHPTDLPLSAACAPACVKQGRGWSDDQN